MVHLRPWRSLQPWNRLVGLKSEAKGVEYLPHEIRSSQYPHETFRQKTRFNALLVDGRIKAARRIYIVVTIVGSPELLTKLDMRSLVLPTFCMRGF